MKRFFRLSALLLVLMLPLSGCKQLAHLFAPAVDGLVKLASSADGIPISLQTDEKGTYGCKYKIGEEGTWVVGQIEDGKLVFSEELPDGEYQVYIATFNSAAEKDDMNRESEPVMITLVIDSQPPAVPVIALTNLSSEGAVSELRPQVTWDAVADAVCYRVRFDGGEWIRLENKVLSYRAAADLSAGAHTVEVLTEDEVGNQSAAALLSFSIDSGSEVPAVKAAPRTKDSRPVWSWDCELTGNDSITGFRVQLNRQVADQWDEATYVYDDLTTSSKKSENWQPATALPDGKHTLYVQSRDYIGNWSASGSFTIEIDTTAPALPKVSGISETNNNQPRWEWELPVDAVTIRYAVDDIDASLLTEADASLLDYTAQTALSNGNHIFYLQCADSLGNWSEFASFSTNVDASKPDAPVVAATAALTRSLRPEWSWTAPAGTVQIRVQLNSESDAGWISLDGGATVYAPSSDLTDGEHILYVQAANELGSWSFSGAAPCSIDNTPPTQPVVSGISPTGDLTPTWRWNGSADTVKYYYRMEGGVWVEADGSQTSYTPVKDLFDPAGAKVVRDYTLEVKAVDGLGNVSSIGSKLIQIDTNTPPSPTYEGPVLTGSSNPTLTWSWTETPQDYGVLINPATPDLVGDPAAYTKTGVVNSYVIPPADALAEGHHKIYLMGQNGTNLWSSPVEIQLEVDQTGPAAPVVQGEVATSTTTLTWTWNRPAEAVSFIIQLNSEPPFNSNELTYSASSLVEGPYHLSVQAVDSLGNPSAATLFESSVDQTAPDAPVNAGPAVSNLSKPTWSWTVKEPCKAYRVSLDSNPADWNSVDLISDSFYKPLSAQTEGAHTLYVKAQDLAGNWSTETAAFVITIDKTGPTKPEILISYAQTSDTTPVWYFKTAAGDAGDSVNMRCRLLPVDSGWTDFNSVTEGQVYDYAAAGELSFGYHNFEVQAQDAAGNWSETALKVVDINSGAINQSQPGLMSFTSVSDDALNGAVRMTWDKQVGCDRYEIIRLTSAELDSGAAGTAVLDSANWAANSSLIDDTANSQFVFYDLSVPANQEYYYRIRGVNSDGNGDLSETFPQAKKELLRGSSFGHVASHLSVQAGADTVGLQWDPVPGATRYALLRTAAYSAEQPSLASATWHSLAASGATSWDVFNLASGDVESILSVSSASFQDTIEVEPYKTYYYKIIAINDLSKSVAEYSSENVVSAGYHISDDYDAIGIYMPASINNLFLASGSTQLNAADNSNNVDSSSKGLGKIRLDVSAPAQYLTELKNLRFNIYRTYRWGGGHQGFYATPDDFTNHHEIYHPNPGTAAFEKTLLLEYSFNGADLDAAGQKTVWDTLYDTYQGEKLSASKLKTVNWKTNGDGGSNKNIYPWYERTASQRAGVDYELVTDPDGSPSEGEFHYLKWDWIFRKYIAHKGAGSDWSKVDFAEAVRGDYVIEIVSTNPAVQTKSITPVTYGYPAMTYREFAFLGMFLRQVTTYRISITYYDMVEDQYNVHGMGLVDQYKRDFHEKCANFGYINVSDSSGAIPNFTGKYYTNDDGSKNNRGLHCSEFPGLSFGVSMDMKITIAKVATSSGVMELHTPLYNGQLQVSMGLVSGCYQHMVQQGGFAVKYDWMPEFSATEDHTIAGEFSSSSTWERAMGNLQYKGRYTSINWSYSDGRSYPGTSQ